MKRYVKVAAAVIVRDGLILCALRGGSATLPGLWEFPGGKIEAGESAAAAVRREIFEELGCQIEVHGKLKTTVHEYEFATVELTTFECTIVDGEPTASEHEALSWLAPSRLHELDWASADIPTVQALTAYMRR